MKKILFVFTAVDFKGGIPRFNRNIIDAATMSDCQIDVLVLNDDGKISDYEESISRYKTFSASKLSLIFCLMRFLFLNKYNKIFIGHINLAPLILMKFVMPLNFMAKGYIFAHGVEIWGRIRGIKKLCLKNFFNCLAVSSYTAKSIVEQIGERYQDKVVVFPNTIPKEWYRDEGVRKLTGAPNDLPNKYILTVSRLDITERKKGIDNLIKALPNINSEYSLVIVGKGNDVDYLKGIANHIGVLNRIIFYHHVGDDLLKKFYKGSLCFVLPSDKEGFGIVYLEAMFHGIPAIGARSKGVIDVIEDHVDGLLVKYGDILGLKNAINELVEDYNLRERIVKNGERKVHHGGSFSFHAFSHRLNSILQS